MGEGGLFVFARLKKASVDVCAEEGVGEGEGGGGAGGGGEVGGLRG